MRKTRWFMVLLTGLLVLGLGLTACLTESGSGGAKEMVPGTYVTEQRGFVDMVKVATTVDRSRILSVEVLEHHETYGIGSFAVEQMPNRIVLHQSAWADTVSGATTTSLAIVAAVEEALLDARADPSGFASGSSKPPSDNREIDVDVVVVGAGGAGLAAAITARNEGMNTLIIEKMDVPGGNTIRSSGGYNTGTLVDGAANRQLFPRTLEAGHWLNCIELLQYMVANSNNIQPWLQNQGIAGGSGNNSGAARILIMNLLNRYELQGGKIMYKVRATDIKMSGNKAVGIIATDLSNGRTLTINAGAVVLASGGFGANYQKCVELDPFLEGFITNNSPCATGDGIWMAEAVGAGLVQLNEIQTHPTVEQKTRNMLTEGIRSGSGGILLNTSGHRFVNDMGFRDVVSAAILAQDQKKAALLFNEELMSNANIREYRDIGLVTPYQTLDEVAEYMGCDPAVLKQTLTEWAAFVHEPNNAEKRSKDPHVQPGSQSTSSNDLTVGPWYCVYVGPGIHHTMGGLAINTYTQVLSKTSLLVEDLPWAGGISQSYPLYFNFVGTDISGSVNPEGDNRDGVKITGTPIPGLFAAGEVTGGIHGGNRQGGNAIADILVFGRTAGYNAARFVNNQAPAYPSGYNSPPFNP
jgi:fumarate reductase flavoprotein subunit